MSLTKLLYPHSTSIHQASNSYISAIYLLPKLAKQAYPKCVSPVAVPISAAESSKICRLTTVNLKSKLTPSNTSCIPTAAWGLIQAQIGVKRTLCTQFFSEQRHLEYFPDCASCFESYLSIGPRGVEQFLATPQNQWSYSQSQWMLFYLHDNDH